MNTTNPVVRGRVGLDFDFSELNPALGLTAYINADTRVLIAAGVGYGFDFGDAGALSIGADVEFFAASDGVDFRYYSNGQYNDQANYVLDLFSIGVSYGIGFAENWGFDTGLYFRFQGATDFGVLDGYTAIKTWEENFASNFQLRWDNQISVDVNDLGLWARVRWNINNLGAKDISVYGKSTTLNLDTEHDLILQAGVSYTFDFSSL